MLMSVIAVETCNVENIIPTDPANAEPQEQVQMQVLGLIAPTKPLKRLVTSTAVKESLSLRKK